MKGILAVLLVLTMILVTPAYATAVSLEGQNFDLMNVKGKCIDVAAADEIINENNSENLNSSNETSNNITGTLYTDEELLNANITEDNTNTTINSTEDNEPSGTPNNTGNSTSLEITTNEENLTETTEEPVSNIYNNTEESKPVAENETITAQVLNTTGIVVQTSNYTCGPAALATVLNNMRINATEQELAILAGTDENGTTMYGLIHGSQVQRFKC